jgi:putative YphP/YqiW family bacilliredoxin
VQPLRDELVAVGFEELRTAQDVDAVFGETQGTLFVMINSVCGCAAGSARPGVALALQHTVIPDRLVTVFAGMEHDAVDRVRELHAGYPPSSPSMALFKDGKLVAMVERRRIEEDGRLARDLGQLFTRYCSRPGPSIPAGQFAARLRQVCGPPFPAIDPADLGASFPAPASGRVVSFSRRGQGAMRSVVLVAGV